MFRSRTPLAAQTVKRLPTMQETVSIPGAGGGGQDPLEKEMATHSSVLARRSPRTEEPGRLQPTGSQSGTRLSEFTLSHCESSVHAQVSRDADAGEHRVLTRASVHSSVTRAVTGRGPAPKGCV